MWKTIILADRENQSQTAKLLSELSIRDFSFKWNWAQREGDLVVEIISKTNDQAWQRAEWLTKKTQVFYNMPHLVEEVEIVYDPSSRPKTCERLQDYWRRVKV